MFEIEYGIEHIIVVAVLFFIAGCMVGAVATFVSTARVNRRYAEERRRFQDEVRDWNEKRKSWMGLQEKQIRRLEEQVSEERGQWFEVAEKLEAERLLRVTMEKKVALLNKKVKRLERKIAALEEENARLRKAQGEAGDS